MEKLLQYIEEQQQFQIQMLQQMVEIESYSRDIEGVNQLGEFLVEQFKHLGYSAKMYGQEGFGHPVLIEHIVDDANPYILLMGHRDTVYPKGTLTQWPFSMDEERIYGPGVADMKGGIVSGYVAMAALKKLGLDGFNIKFLITPDEEIGSPQSRAVIEEVAKGALAVFNLEPGRKDGSIVSGRKGSGHLELELTGKASHAGLEYEQGISTIKEGARIINDLYQLVDLEQGNIVNIGMIEGGSNTNVVAAKTKMKILFCFNTVAQGEILLKQIKEIVARAEIAQVKHELTGGIKFLPMESTEENKALLSIVQEAIEELGLEVNHTFTKGAADAGFTSSLGIPTICAMGPVGGNYHTKDEYIELASVTERTKLLALSILKTWGNMENILVHGSN